VVERERLALVERSLREHFFASSPPGYLETDWGRRDLEHHLRARLETDRSVVVPWLASIADLRGARILEIGCGTGSSTVALAEAGAQVVGIDIEEPSMTVARDRCCAYEVSAEFAWANAADLPSSIRERPFDLIIFYASLEHMTVEERLRAMRTTWGMLPIGGLWSMIETPNRLWYFDSHTSLLPFFMWLPDDLAFQYSKFSERPRFNDLYREPTPEAVLHFLRRGRGVSFHEIELAMGRLRDLEVAGWLDWRKTKTLRQRLQNARSTEGQYRRFLRRVAPRVHEAFLQPRLDVVVRKGGGGG
jgi:S-adenosylmethionine-dependent methyltransferase